MAELVAATCIPRVTKEHLFLFDKIACPLSADFFRSTQSPDHAAAIQDLLWLREQKILITPKIDLSPPHTASAEWIQAVDEYRAPRTGADEAAAWAKIDVVTRAYALQLRHVDRVNAVPVTTGWHRSPDDSVTRADVIQLVLRQLPVPGDRHGLQDILAFREEARAEGLSQSLRVWINEMASGGLSRIEVSDTLEHLVSRYERMLAVEKMQRDTSIIETLVVTTAEIAESLVKFQWSAAAKKLFEVRHRQIDLMKAEMTLPGREVAYIVKARERFGG